MANFQDESFGRDTVMRRLADAVGAININDLAEKLDISAKTVATWKHRGAVPYEHVERFAIKNGASLDWIMLGRRKKEVMGVGEALLPYDAFAEFALVPRYDVRASAGPGSLIQNETVVDRLAFKKEWVYQLGLNPLQLALIQIEGTSMEPTLLNKDLVLLNLKISKFVTDGIYVIQYDGLLLVKRLQRMLSGHVLIKSDNSAYEPETVSPAEADNLQIIGEVVWFGREVPK